MELPVWITIVSDIACTIIGGIFGFFIKTILVKNKEKRKLSQNAGDNSTQIQIGGDYHVER